jgi:hypothetical protein
MEGEETHLQRRLIKPVRDVALSRAATAMSQTLSFKVVYQTLLVQPVPANLEQRNAIRLLIVAYRLEHQV